jgi:hypothetical protein
LLNYLDVDEQAEDAYRAATDHNYDPFREKLQKTLEQYEEAIADPEGFRNPKEREIAATVVEDIKNQISKIDRLSKRPADGETERDVKSMIKSISTSIEDKRIRGLKEIFGFYSKQHQPQGVMFGDILAKQDNLDLGEFLMFARDFQIPLNKKKTIEVFKKTSSLRQLPVSFDEFCEVLNKVSIELNIEKINAVKKRLREIRKIEKEQGLNKVKKETPKEEEKKTEEKPSTDETKKEGEGDDESPKKDGKEGTKEDTKENKSGVKSDDSGSESKSKTAKKSGKSKTGESGSDDGSASGDETRPLSGNSKNKSVRFNAKGDGHDNLQHSDIDERRSVIIENAGPLRNPILVEKDRLEIELEKYKNKTSEECHEDIMNILEVHDPQKFRKKAKGVQVVPFAMKDFYYRISKDEIDKRSKKISKLSAAQIKDKVEEMKIRREQQRHMRERQTEITKKKLIEEQNRKLERNRKQKMNTANRQRKVYVDGKSVIDHGYDTVDVRSKETYNKREESPIEQKESYRVRKNKSKGLPDEEGKHTKVTMELLNKLHYKDIMQNLPDDFKPEKYITEDDGEDDGEESVFRYFFPGEEKKKPKKKVKGENYSEQIMNMKREINDNNAAKLKQDVAFEKQELMYKSEKESRNNAKTNRSIQPSNPAQSK